MDCKECKSTRKPVESIPYVAYEGALTRFEKQMKRLWVALLITIILLFASNGIWVWYINQYDFSSNTTTTTIEADRDGEGVNIVGAGDIDYGAEGQDNG